MSFIITSTRFHPNGITPPCCVGYLLVAPTSEGVHLGVLSRPRPTFDKMVEYPAWENSRKMEIYRIAREITHPLVRFPLLGSSTTVGSCTPSDAFMEISRKILEVKAYRVARKMTHTCQTWVSRQRGVPTRRAKPPFS